MKEAETELTTLGPEVCVGQMCLCFVVQMESAFVRAKANNGEGDLSGACRVLYFPSLCRMQLRAVSQATRSICCTVPPLPLSLR